MAITVVTTGGLCNMLRVTFSYLLKAKSENKVLNVFWQPTDACPQHFLELFQPVNGLNFINSINNLNIADKADKTDIAYIGFDAYSETNTPLMYAELKPLPKYNPWYASELTQRFAFALNEPYIAVHIRRTDHSVDAKQNNKYTSDEDFIKFIDDNPNINLYIATDNRATQDKFYARYKNRIKGIKFIEPSIYLRQTSLGIAVIDIFVCVNAVKFMGSGWSSFSDLINDIRTLQGR
uniref:Glycosyltransferase n=1 Tax=viral metagenome TaxID=1070528 RepID=A0A6C0HN41_9ZZZZ